MEVKVVLNGREVFSLPLKEVSSADLKTKNRLGGGRDLNLGDQVEYIEVSVQGKEEPDAVQESGTVEVPGEESSPDLQPVEEEVRDSEGPS